MALPKRFRKHRGWLAFLVIVAIAGTVWFVTMRSNKSEAAQTTYTTEAASTGTLSVTVSGSGNLELASEREVWPKTGGTVDEVKVDEGDKVSKGDVLFTLDSSDAEAATSKALTSYRQAQSQVAQAEAQLTKAKSNLSNLKDKADDPQTTVTSADIKSAEADVSSASASLSSAQASASESWSSYNDALDAEDELEVTAPASGRVWTIDIDEGDSVSTGSSGSSASSSSDSAAGASSTGTTASTGSSAPITIAPTKPLVATLAINEVDLPSLKKGQRADLEFDALPDLAMTGEVTGIADEGTVSSGVVTFDVTVRLDVVNKKLKPGMTVAASIV
ncbi:MAG TPA: efflux RND transporter periplasmic adaptor subunit, partial [Coriobacteriia bacterium]|nr:efflux RND transporter periplasmic adaptor subunit [Coriobacteriia bacterium]